VVKALTSARAGGPSDGRNGARRAATIYEVAERAGVSIATVSRVQRNPRLVAPATRERVLSAVADLDYRPSRLGRSLARGRHDAIGIVFPDLSGPYYSAVILGYEEASAAEGSSVLILATHRRPDATMQVLDLADRVDGIVLMGRTVDDEVVAELERRRLPIVLLARAASGRADSVRAENADSARRLTAHVLEHGHRRIAFLGDPDASPDAAERWAGFVDAHEAVGRSPWRGAFACGYRESDGRSAAAEVLAEAELPTALICANDEIATGALEAARRAGLAVPGDLAMTGWDDIPVARHLSPPLTTVRQPMVELGRRSAQLLHDRITSGRTDPRHEVLPAEVVVRASCGCAHEQGGNDR
jgi:LacI family transcriptional regulator